MHSLFASIRDQIMCVLKSKAWAIVSATEVVSIFVSLCLCVCDVVFVCVCVCVLYACECVCVCAICV